MQRKTPVALRRSILCFISMMAVTSTFRCGKSTKPGCRPARSLNSFHQHSPIVLFTLLLSACVVKAQEMKWYVTWTAGSLCDKKPAADFESWEQSFTSLQTCCEEKFSYDYDNCCNPTAPGLTSCFEEACQVRTCSNGLYSDSQCKCLCVPSFTLDDDGDCTVPVAAGSSDNAFESCEMSGDCPWWSDPLRLEKCDTGAGIPDDVTQMYWTKEECCESHHPGSKFCIGGTAGGGDDDDAVDLSMFELVPVKFSISNVPDDVDVLDLKEQVRIVLKDFLLELAGRFTGAADLGVSSVRETNRFQVLDGGTNQLGIIYAYYDVKVIREPGQDFAPTIIEEIVNSHMDIVKGIQDSTLKDAYINICLQDNGGETMRNDPTSPVSSLFNRCTLDPEEVSVKVQFKDLPLDIINNTVSFESVKMQVSEVYEQILTESIDGMELLSIEESEEILLPDGTADVHFNIVLRGGNYDVDYAVAIEEKIASSSDIIVTQLQSYTDQDTDWNIYWCIKEEGILTACDPGEKPLSEVGVNSSGSDGVNVARSFPLWGYIVIGSVAGVILLVCMCCWCRCEGCEQCCSSSRKVSRVRSRKAEAFNRVNMKTYIDSGRFAQKQQRSSSGRPPKLKSRKSSFARVDRNKRGKKQRSHSRETRYDRRYRPDRERRRSSRSRKRDERKSKSKRKSSSKRRKRSGRRRYDSDDSSVSSSDLESPGKQIVVYEGEPHHQRQIIISNEQKPNEEQVNRAANITKQRDPDGVVLAEVNNQAVYAEDGDRIVSFTV